VNQKPILATPAANYHAIFEAAVTFTRNPNTVTKLSALLNGGNRWRARLA
jgi:hypothetical protein